VELSTLWTGQLGTAMQVASGSNTRVTWMQALQLSAVQEEAVHEPGRDAGCKPTCRHSSINSDASGDRDAGMAGSSVDDAICGAAGHRNSVLGLR
jgi:hypothetical protein